VGKQWRRFIDPSVMTYVVGVPTIVVAGILAYRENQTLAFPGPLELLTVFAFTAAFLVLASESFAVLMPVENRMTARSSFFVSQLVKYIPAGGLAQFVSQASQLKAGSRQSAFIVTKSKLVAAVGGLVWGGVFASVADELPVLVRLGCAAGVLSVVVLWAPFLHRVERAIGAVDADASEASLTDLARSLILAVLSVGASGAAFTIALRSVDESGHTVTILSGYAVAWTIGYLAVPFPGGIGIREGALALLLPTSAANILVAAIVVRLVQIGGELLLALVVSPLIRKRSEAET